MRLLIDTDIGDDIDDALALALAMDEGADIVGLTTVFGDTVKRARMAKKLLSLGGYGGVPIFCGYSGSMMTDGIRPPDLYTSELDGDEFAPDSEKPEEAVSFIVNACRKYGDGLTLLCLGPMTNIARALAKDPEAVRSARVVMMGGAYFRQYADWNVSCDPPSAKTVFDGLSGMHCIGADVTHLLRLGNAEEQALLSYGGDRPHIKYLSQMMALYRARKGEERTALHDPLALYYALGTDICEMAEARISVVTDGPAAGLTLNIKEYSKSWMNPCYEGYSPPTQQVALSVDAKRMMERFLSLFAK